MHTEVSCEPDVSYARHRELCANHQKNMDNSLINLLSARYPVMNLIPNDLDSQPHQKSKSSEQLLSAQLPVLMPFEDNRPYLIALLPPESLNELEF